MEGLPSSFLFKMGSLGFIILDWYSAPNIPNLSGLLLFNGFAPAEFLHGWNTCGKKIAWLPDGLVPFQKKSVDPGFAPDNEIWKAEPLPCAMWKRMKNTVKALSETLASNEN